MFCSCGYALSRQYVHVAKNGREAQYRYKCRWQIINMSKYTEEAAHLMGGGVCENPAVSEMKVWLGSKYVFKYLFKNGKAAVIRALELIGQCRQEERKLEDGTDISGLEERLNTFIDFKGEKISSEMIDMFVERVIYRGQKWER